MYQIIAYLWTFSGYRLLYIVDNTINYYQVLAFSIIVTKFLLLFCKHFGFIVSLLSWKKASRLGDQTCSDSFVPSLTPQTNPRFWCWETPFPECVACDPFWRWTMMLSGYFHYFLLELLPVFIHFFYAQIFEHGLLFLSSTNFRVDLLLIRFKGLILLCLAEIFCICVA